MSAFDPLGRPYKKWMVSAKTKEELWKTFDKEVPFLNYVRSSIMEKGGLGFILSVRYT